jgi:hypothetical protein
MEWILTSVRMTTEKTEHFDKTVLSEVEGLTANGLGLVHRNRFVARRHFLLTMPR